MADLEIEVCGIKMKNPVMPAAGTLVRDLDSMRKVASSGVGAMVTKTVSTEAARDPLPNLAQVDRAFFNCELWGEISPEIWVNQVLPQARELGLPLIVSLGYTSQQIDDLAPRVKPYADAVELSTHYLGDDLALLIEPIKVARRHLDVPIWVKVSPNIPDVKAMAIAAEKAGADAIVAINSLGPTLSIDVERVLPRLGSPTGYGWLSGPALKPLAVRYVYEISQSVEIPVIGVGGISRGTDVVEMMMAGASAVQLLTAAILNGVETYTRVIQGLESFLDQHGYSSASDIVGLFHRVGRIRYTSPPLIDQEKCNLCRLCVKSCAYDALAIVGDQLVVDPEKCDICGLCQTRCPRDAISFQYQLLPCCNERTLK
ncbi:MAG: Dihydroorotate dehydrogenase B (NAD(+)), catalytic subunit [Actinobacteria bacterium]|nr:Dihydroorotate dehydrogenase B (NAD(+)), catalytic subunit [Actinomycetota bacterium]